jgi:hypothetical protein
MKVQYGGGRTALCTVNCLKQQSTFVLMYIKVQRGGAYIYYQGRSHDAHGRSQKSNKIVKDKVKAQSRQSARPFL